MSETTTNPYGITREEILNLAAQKIADEFSDMESIENTSARLIRERVEKCFTETIKGKIEAFLTEEMTKIVSTEITPVDIWGEKVGQPTTIRAQLAVRAKAFWDVKVNSEGREETYGGKSRHEWLFQKIVNEEFNKVVKQNIVNLVGAFKDALSASANAITKEHIDSLIKVKTQNS